MSSLLHPKETINCTLSKMFKCSSDDHCLLSLKLLVSIFSLFWTFLLFSLILLICLFLIYTTYNLVIYSFQEVSQAESQLTQWPNSNTGHYTDSAETHIFHARHHVRNIGSTMTVEFEWDNVTGQSTKGLIAFHTYNITQDTTKETQTVSSNYHLACESMQGT